MDAMASQITSLKIVYSTIHSGADQRKDKKIRVTGLCAGNSPVTGECPAQTASNAETVFIWWRHREEWRDGDCAVISILLSSLISLWEVIVSPNWHHTLYWFTLSLDVWILFYCIDHLTATVLTSMVQLTWGSMMIHVNHYGVFLFALWLSGLFMWDVTGSFCE